jgi:hypothetical protein
MQKFVPEAVNALQKIGLKQTAQPRPARKL